MLSINKTIKKISIISMMLIFTLSLAYSQTAPQSLETPPVWWFGASAAANFNFYTGTTQQLNNSLTIPTALHKGNGVRPYASLLAEYRPNRIVGFMLNVGYDGLGAKYNGAPAPCDCPEALKADLSYVSVEPSLRIGFNTTDLYFFAGPSLAFNVDRDFYYTQLKQPNTNSQLIDVNKTIFSGQIGVGYDIMISPASSETKFSLSPFVSYHPYFGQDPRSIESLSVTTIRAGVALKFGRGHKVPLMPPPVVVPNVVIAPVAPDIMLTIIQPDFVPLKRLVSETFPLVNAVFFNKGSKEIPDRYVLLTNDQANNFKEVQLQNQQSESMPGRSAGQLNVYYNVLNITGDRMRLNPGANITLDGSSPKGPEEARDLAMSVKQYLVTVFGIESSRIAITGSLTARPSSEHPGGTKDLPLLKDEDRRVDIESKSPELLVEVGGGMMKPVQILETQVNPLDSHVIFSIDSAQEKLKSWSIDITAASGAVQHYGPFTSDDESIPGTTILGDSPSGDFKIVILAESNSGPIIRKESTIHLVRQDVSVEKGYRFSIIFDFDKAKSIEEYDKFLTNIVAPLIISNSKVIIHGHTDIIGYEAFNRRLSQKRAKGTEKILQRAIANSGRSNVKFVTVGYGANVNHLQFGNNLPEERFYNRSVIIDIIPVK